MWSHSIILVFCDGTSFKSDLSDEIVRSESTGPHVVDRVIEPRKDQVERSQRGRLPVASRVVSYPEMEWGRFLVDSAGRITPLADSFESDNQRGDIK